MSTLDIALLSMILTVAHIELYIFRPALLSWRMIVAHVGAYTDWLGGWVGDC